IDWWTVDTGGGLLTGGNYSLESSIGQPDAGATMTGGSYSLVGGYQVGAESMNVVYLPLVLKL
ncbi:MAG: hypothetical protein JW981_04645, partial [Anaerolineae bacterium]|nr:hypothetical protein [Anaerolineae bacterium]